jgi:hypothetical protein
VRCAAAEVRYVRRFLPVTCLCDPGWHQFKISHAKTRRGRRLPRRGVSYRRCGWHPGSKSAGVASSRNIFASSRENISHKEHKDHQEVGALPQVSVVSVLRRPGGQKAASLNAPPPWCSLCTLCYHFFTRRRGDAEREGRRVRAEARRAQRGFWGAVAFHFPPCVGCDGGF